MELVFSLGGRHGLRVMACVALVVVSAPLWPSGLQGVARVLPTLASLSLKHALKFGWWRGSDSFELPSGASPQSDLKVQALQLVP